MTTEAPPPQEECLYVTWREPGGSIHPIGLLIRRVDGDGDHFRFAYLKMAEVLDDFQPLAGLPDLHRRYESDELFPVFAHRVMPRSRPEFDALARRVQLGTDADPFEVLARSGGRRATDRVEVFSPPHLTEDGRSSCHFFVRGIRHLPQAAPVVAGLRAGEVLDLVDDPDNRYNARAVLLRSDGTEIGWIPDYLVEHVHQLRELNDANPTVVVEHVNGEDSPSHQRVLCRLDAPWPLAGFEPFDDARFEPLVSLDI